MLIATLVTAVGVLLADRFYYGNDDLLQFGSARDHGFSWTTLTQIVFQHFAPYNRLGHLVVHRFSDLSPALGLTLVLVNYTAVLAAALWLMSELRLSAARRAVALILIGLSAPMTESAVWFDAGMHILPAIAVTIGVCAAHVRAVRTGRLRWHGVTVALFVLGQLTQERPVFALPLLVLADVLLLWRDLPWRERMQRLWQQRAVLAVLTVLAVAIAVALRLFVVDETGRTPGWGVTARTMLSAFGNYVLPAMVNQPLAEPAGTTRELVVLAAVLVVGVVLARLAPGNAGPLLFAATTVLLYYGFLRFSTLLSEDSITRNAERLHNAVYVTVPATIALVHLRLRRRVATPWAHPPRVAVRAAGCLALAAYLVASDVAYLDRRWDDTTRARAYLDAVRAAAPEWSDPDVTLIPLLGHPAMATSWSGPYSRHDRMLDLIAPGYAPRDVGPRMVLIDHRGAVQPAAVETVVPDVQVLRGSCGEVPRSGRVLLDTGPIEGSPLFVRLDYRAADDLLVRSGTRWAGTWSREEPAGELPAGAHTRLIPLDRGVMDAVELVPLAAGARLCVTAADVVRPLMVVDDGDRCRVVDRRGRPGQSLDCPR